MNIQKFNRNRYPQWGHKQVSLVPVYDVQRFSGASNYLGVPITVCTTAPHTSPRRMPHLAFLIVFLEK